MTAVPHDSATPPTARPGVHGAPDPTPDDLATLRRVLEVDRDSLRGRTAAGDDEPDPLGVAGRTQAETERAVIDTERRVNAVLEAGAREALREVEQALAPWTTAATATARTATGRSRSSG
jgi:hypothetical protein